MKLQEMTAPEIYRSGIDVNDRVAFTMVANKKSFKILSSNIYKYKIRAIIREVSCNAIDGHIAAGHVLPFDVQLPTMLDPRFIVRDYGVGLSDDDVRYHATVYFASSKIESPDFIGCLGLGFKSPFCHSDTFNIISWHDGVKRTYVAYMENGEPFVDLLEEIPSNEHVGVQIIVPAKADEVEEWVREARRVYTSFTSIRPNFIGIDPCVKYQPVTSDREDGVIIHKSNTHRGVYARMGNIMYPIDDELYAGTLLALYANGDSAYIFDFPLGDLDFMPSREELSMDKITKARIVERIEKINNGYHESLLKAFRKRKTIRQKVAFYKSKTNLMTYMTRESDFNVNDKPISYYVPSTDYKLLDDLETTGYWANSYNGAKFCDFKRVGRGRYETQSRLDINKILDPSQQEKLYLVDVDESTYKAALSGYCILQGKNQINFLNSRTDKDLLDAIIAHGHFEEADIVRLKVSEMTKEKEAYYKKYPKPVRAKKSEPGYEPRPKTPTAIMYTLVDGEVHKENLFLTKKEFIELPPVAAIKLFAVSDYSPIDTDGFWMHTEVDDLLMRKTGIDKVLYIRNSLWDKIPESNVYCFYGELQKLFKTAVTKLKPNNYGCVGNDKYVKIMHSEYGVTLDRLVKNRYDAENYEMAEFLVKKIQNCYYGDTEQPNKELYKLTQQFMKNNAAMQVRTNTAFEKFKELNPICYAILEVLYSYRYLEKLRTKEAKEDFVKLIRWK